MRWGKVRDLLDQVGDGTGVIELAATLGAFVNVGLERRRTESNFVVDKLIDFVGQKMSVVHCLSFTRWCWGEVSTVIDPFIAYPQALPATRGALGGYRS